jgi:hypothetical protein
MHTNTATAIVEGRRRWVDRMHEAKERGEIVRFPGGRRAPGLPPLSKDPKIRKAQRIVEKELAEMARTRKKQPNLLGPAPKPWQQLSRAEKLERASDLGLNRAYEILQLGVDPLNPKVLAIVQNTALTIISRQIAIEAAQADQSHPVSTGLSRSEALALLNACDRIDALLTVTDADQEVVSDGSGS